MKLDSSLFESASTTLKQKVKGQTVDEPFTPLRGRSWVIAAAAGGCSVGKKNMLHYKSSYMKWKTLADYTEF